MSQKVRLGMIGTGRRARSLMRLWAAHPLCEIVALCDRSRPLVEQAASTLDKPGVRLYTSYEDLLREGGVDALLITMPPDMQADVACEAMERGIHVATEVPAAYTIDQCWKLVRTVEKTGAKYQLCEQVRFWGFVQAWREMARRGEFGKIIFVEGEYLHFEAWDYWVDPNTGEVFRGSATPPPGRDVEPTWRNRTFRHPIFYLPHTLGPLLSILNDRVVRVSCMGTRPASYFVEGYPGRDLEVALMHTEKDVLMRVAVGFTSPHGPRPQTVNHWMQVMGTEATVEWARAGWDKPKIWRRGDADWQPMEWTVRIDDAPEFIRSSGHGGADGWPVEAFLRAVAEDGPVSMDVYQAVESAAPAILAARSAELGGELLEVPDFRASAAAAGGDPAKTGEGETRAAAGGGAP